MLLLPVAFASAESACCFSQAERLVCLLDTVVVVHGAACARLGLTYPCVCRSKRESDLEESLMTSE